MSRILLLILCLFCSAGVAVAAGMEITPFSTFNQSPLVQIYGLPHESGADIIPSGKLHIAINQDLTSNYSVSSYRNELVTLDGETYRLAIAARYGFASGWEAGFEVPYIIQGGGFLDSFIIDWHNSFGLPQGGRDRASKNRINYSYSKDSAQKLLVDRSSSGVGDISLTGGVSLYDVLHEGEHDRLALKGAIKLPTGDSSNLAGSGGTDLMLQLCGSSTSYGEYGSLGVYGSAGALVMSRGDVLSDQHNVLAGVGTVGLGWGPASWISFKTQLDGHTPMYHGSSLNELGTNTLVLVLGGALRLPGEYLLDIAVAEDVLVSAAPDVSFHLGLSKQF
ncbi:MAG: DUF3187 family protein [Desulfuromonadaceae bacterium]|nr:DUF3187 family protein [Desulfuromonadaceae bacterium]MDD4131153.1 DUF3187 family protein [Desulfuromonadaceae bacterium]